jgi:hypothetical protein
MWPWNGPGRGTFNANGIAKLRKGHRKLRRIYLYAYVVVLCAFVRAIVVQLHIMAAALLFVLLHDFFESQQLS